MSFKSFIKDEKIEYSVLTEEMESRLDEVLITFNNRPRFNQVVLLAGGAGSGKGFMTGKLLGIDAKTFDVDQIKSQIIHPGTVKINKAVMDKYGIDVTKMNLTNPEDVKMLHQINDEMGYSKKVQANFFKDLDKLAGKEMLPNVIFDTTMKSEKKIMEIVHTVQMAGYKRENIHIIWIMTPAKIAVKQNRDPSRGRVVPEDILLDTHKGVADNMYNLMKNSSFQEHIDGYVYVIFNQKDVDNKIATLAGHTGSYVKEALILELKRRGKKQISFSDIATHFIRKIKRYVPKEVSSKWGKF